MNKIRSDFFILLMKETILYDDRRDGIMGGEGRERDGRRLETEEGRERGQREKYTKTGCSQSQITRDYKQLRKTIQHHITCMYIYMHMHMHVLQVAIGMESTSLWWIITLSKRRPSRCADHYCANYHPVNRHC